MSQASNHKLLQKLTGYIDGWIVPIAFGTFSVLVVAQFLTSFGPVRTYVDRIEGRFVEQPAAVIPTSVNKESQSRYHSNAKRETFAEVHNNFTNISCA